MKGGMKMKIYCAGPLFNEKEREEMSEIANVLEKNIFKVFLPQRDGLLFSELYSMGVKLGYEEEIVSKVLRRAIFELDSYAVIEECDGLVLNINGRVPDEGALIEGAWAWCNKKYVVIYKSDSRGLINGLDNPLIEGLSLLEYVEKIEDIPSAFHKLASANGSHFEKVISRGRKIFDLILNKSPKKIVIKKLLEEIGE